MTSNVKTYTLLLIALSPVALFILSLLAGDVPVMVFMPLFMAQYAFIAVFLGVSRLKLIGDIKKQYPGFDTTFIGPFTVSRFLKQVDDPTFNDRYLGSKLFVRAVFCNFFLGVVLGFAAGVLS